MLFQREKCRHSLINVFHSPFARRTLPLSYTSLSGISSLIALPSSAICKEIEQGKSENLSGKMKIGV